MTFANNRLKVDGHYSAYNISELNNPFSGVDVTENIFFAGGNKEPVKSNQ